ncbi:MAG: hypothetical protein KME28_06880 [Pelatocladus maniniholoensis HA4357-MV3]|jgi:hypothetical protein|uniref:Uncharacterized protein n=1 Tax=Pelatocladus maniniholoensis HA4357-MV3 TaxID=1117104 RepID=A0A9E3H5Z0_9NOST|nr:hypothetical protein [Pelatocladus maniniholoensis HA4357-MV3]BAZ69951.1 hypothetical protein NIES4106_47320 [Fischerella sp. NIES-4106]
MNIKTQKSALFKPVVGKSDVDDQRIKEQRVKINAGTGLYMESSKWAKVEKTVSPRYRFTSAKEQVCQIKKTWYIFPSTV